MKLILKKHLIPLIGFVGLTFFSYPGIFIHFSSHLIRGTAGDLKNILSIISYSIQAPLAELYHLPIFHPEPYMLTKTHPLFGISLFYKGFDFFGLTLTQGTNLYIILSLVLGAWGTYLLINEVLTRKYHLPAFLFSTIYIIHPLNHLHFVWLNFLSHFYIPFILLFLLKYFKSGRKLYLPVIALLIFLQALSSIYYGFFLFTLLLPCALLIAWKLKVLTWPRFRFFIISMIPVILCLFIVFSPYILQNQGSAKHFDGKLIQPQELFSHARLLSPILAEAKNIGQYYFPGFLFTASILMVWGSLIKKHKEIIYAIMMAALILICVLVYVQQDILNLFLIIFWLLLIYLTVKHRSQIEPHHLWVIVITMISTFVLVQFTYPGILEKWVPYRLLFQMVPIGGLTVIKRVGLMFLPLFSVLAAIGMTRAFPRFGDTTLQISSDKSLKNKSLIKNTGLLLLLLSIMMVENLRNPLIYLPPKNGIGVMAPLPAKAPVYDHLPNNNGHVLLEIPYYFRRRLKNVDYMLNQRFHWNKLLNGKVSIFPAQYYRNLSNHIGKFQMDFPNEAAIKALKKEYQVDYIIIHRQALKNYQSIHRTPVSKTEILTRIQQLSHHLEIIFQDEHQILLKIKKRNE
jgi:hypothetical protein